MNRHLEDEHLALMRRHQKLEEIRRAEASLNKASGKPRTHLVIGDSHARPGVPNERFLWAGRLACEIGADVVIDIGDSFDMQSILQHNRYGWDKRRIELDLEVGKDAWALFEKGLAGHKPKKLRTLGNHENRIMRLLAEEPRLEGLLIPDFGSQEMGWTEAPYGEPVMVDGVAYCHAFLAPGTGKEIGGVMPARAVAIRRHQSAVFGHTHLRSYHEETDAIGRRIQVLNCGAFFPQHELYAGFSGNAAWWRGLCVLRGVKNGEYDVETIGYGRVEAKFKG